MTEKKTKPARFSMLKYEKNIFPQFTFSVF